MEPRYGVEYRGIVQYYLLAGNIQLLAALAVCAIAASLMRATTATLPPDPTGPDDPPPADPGLIAFTVAEFKRLLSLLTRPIREAPHHLHWTW